MGRLSLPLTRRELLYGSMSAAAFEACGEASRGWRPAAAQGRQDRGELFFRHGWSLFGHLKYPADFEHFDYVNPDAPKGGVVRQSALGTFDNFNIVIAGARGLLALGIELLYDTLMVQALDEVSTDYGLLAEGVSYPDDYRFVTYRLRPDARWHDGKPVTPRDVIFSFDVFRKNNPQLADYYRHVTTADQTGEREVTFRCDKSANRELPHIVGQLRILPQHWWEGLETAGKKRDVAATMLEPPLGCGAYRLKNFLPGRLVVYERVPDYWGTNLPVNVGRSNFDEIRIEYFRDTTIAFEAFKADQLDWHVEISAKNWATAYDFPAVHEERVVLEEFPIRNVGVMQAFAFNTRRDKFKDARVRLAFNYGFDFEAMNRQLFFSQYTRITSYFQGTELASSGLPEGLELEILETVRGEVPPEVFTTAYSNPVGGSPEAVRKNRHRAIRLLREAGYEVSGMSLVDSRTGEPYTVEFLVSDPTTERISLFYKPSLERLGMTVIVRIVDQIQYQNRLREWDFDIVTAVWWESLTPGNRQLAYWGSEAADQPGSRNLIGIRNAAVDALISRVIFAGNRAELIAATRALDRVLLWHHFVVPQWTYGKERSARWDRFGRPDKLPAYGVSAFPTLWWWDEAKAARLGRRM
jgi:microcin C transport system substrate-binding protein